MSLLVPGGSAGAGWTLYPPLTINREWEWILLFLQFILGMSSIMGSINIVTTILNMRAPGMTLMKMPLFVWTWLITAYLLIAVMPVLAGAVTMTLTDRHFDTHFLILLVAEILYYSSIFFGFLVIPKYILLLFLHLA